MTLADLLRELARPAPHDHRPLTTDQRVAENVARAAATGAVLGVHAALWAGVGIVNTARTARVVIHLLRDR